MVAKPIYIGDIMTKLYLIRIEVKQIVYFAYLLHNYAIRTIVFSKRNIRILIIIATRK